MALSKLIQEGFSRREARERIKKRLIERRKRGVQPWVKPKKEGTVEAQTQK